MTQKNNILNQKLSVINIGLESFKETLQEKGVPCIQVDWKPGMSVPLESKKIIDNNKSLIEKANAEAIDRIQNGKPFIVGMGQAKDVIKTMSEIGSDKTGKSNTKVLLHAGPPITWERMCGPMRGAMMGALIYEKWATTAEEAEKQLSSNEIIFSPCHEHNAVGPMAGVISPSMPVFIIENESYKNFAYTTMNEGLGKVLRYGAYSDEVITRLTWMEKTLYPVLQRAITHLKKVDLKAIIAQALHMGDEVHNRNRAATSLLYRVLAPAIVFANENKQEIIESLNFINGNDHFFLNLSMSACKATLSAADNIAGSSVVTIMARNGTDFGIKLAGTKGEWFVGPAEIPDALFFPGFSKADANADIGDSAITETAGLGGLAMASAPAIVQFVGGNASDSKNYTLDMYEITLAENNVYQIPALDFRGTPTGIDVRLVVAKNLRPFINTGVAHKLPGIGQVGAGVLSAPMEPFQLAYTGLAKSLV